MSYPSPAPKFGFLHISVALLAVMNIGLLRLVLHDRRHPPRYEEINAERINIIGASGKPVMALSNQRLIPGPGMNGKIYPKEYADGRQYFSGIILFNESGDEVGGLIYNGFPKDSGYFATEHLSFDQWKQNQVVAMQYIDNGKTRRAGLRIWDRPTNVPLDEIFDRYKVRNAAQKGSPEYNAITQQIKASADRGDNGVERMFIGSQDEVAQIQLRDNKANVRAKFYVAPNGTAKLDFLDAEGHVTKTITQ